MYLPSYSILEEIGGCSKSFNGHDKAFLFVFVFAFVFAFILCLSSKKESKCGVQWLIYWIWQCGGGDRHPPPIAHVLGSTHIVLLYMLIMMIMMMMLMMMVMMMMIVRMSLLATMYIYDSIDHKDDVWWLLSAVRKLMLMKKGPEMNRFQDVTVKHTNNSTLLLMHQIPKTEKYKISQQLLSFQGATMQKYVFQIILHYSWLESRSNMVIMEVFQGNGTEKNWS